MYFIQSYLEFFWSENEFTSFFYFQMFSWPYSSWINEREAKSQNVKTYFETQVSKLR